MSGLAKGLAAFVPVLAMGIGTAGSAGLQMAPRALALNVDESGGFVEIELVANSQVTQQVEYSVELTGSSNARHSGNTSVAKDERHVLSRMRTSVTDSWCAKVEVTEASGAQYTLTAGDC